MTIAYIVPIAVGFVALAVWFRCRRHKLHSIRSAAADLVANYIHAKVSDFNNKVCALEHHLRDNADKKKEEWWTTQHGDVRECTGRAATDCQQWVTDGVRKLSGLLTHLRDGALEQFGVEFTALQSVLFPDEHQGYTLYRHYIASQEDCERNFSLSTTRLRLLLIFRSTENRLVNQLFDHNLQRAKECYRAVEAMQSNEVRVPVNPFLLFGAEEFTSELQERLRHQSEKLRNMLLQLGLLCDRFVHAFTFLDRVEVACGGPLAECWLRSIQAASDVWRDGHWGTIQRDVDATLLSAESSDRETEVADLVQRHMEANPEVELVDEDTWCKEWQMSTLTGYHVRFTMPPTEESQRLVRLIPPTMDGLRRLLRQDLLTHLRLRKYGEDYFRPLAKQLLYASSTPHALEVLSCAEQEVQNAVEALHSMHPKQNGEPATPLLGVLTEVNEAWETAKRALEDHVMGLFRTAEDKLCAVLATRVNVDPAVERTLEAYVNPLAKGLLACKSLYNGHIIVAELQGELHGIQQRDNTAHNLKEMITGHMSVLRDVREQPMFQSFLPYEQMEANFAAILQAANEVT